MIHLPKSSLAEGILFAAISPVVGRATRRNVEAPRQAALGLQLQDTAA